MGLASRKESTKHILYVDTQRMGSNSGLENPSAIVEKFDHSGIGYEVTILWPGIMEEHERFVFRGAQFDQVLKTMLEVQEWMKKGEV